MIHPCWELDLVKCVTDKAAIQVPGVCPREILPHIASNSYTKMFKAFSREKIGTAIKMPSIPA